MNQTSPSPFSPEILKEAIHILVVEDEDATRQFLQICLEQEGYFVVAVCNGQEALQTYKFGSFDLIILDTNMPVMDGWTVCARLRQQTSVPILMLTANHHPDDIVRGLRLGVDHYVTKPFTLKELRARIQALLRRATQQPTPPAQPLRCGEIVMREDLSEVTVQGQKVELSPTEYRLLRFFMQNPDQLLSKEKLLDGVWDSAHWYWEDSNFIRATIHRLRAKVEENPSRPKYLKTLHGRGYMLCAKEHGVAPTRSSSSAESFL